MGPEQQKPQQIRLNPEMTKLASEQPDEYKKKMISLGRKNELTPDDHIRAATVGFVKQLGLFK